MPRHTPSGLDVYLSGSRVGRLVRPGSGRLSFEYDAGISSERAGELILSASLLVQTARFSNGRTRPFFEGLLPEGAVREQVAREFRVSPENAFGLLTEIGAECAGAVVIVPAGQRPTGAEETSVRWLTDGDLAQAISRLPSHPLGVGPDVRLSLGGVQQKLIVTRAANGRFGQPLGGAPSTHIIKPNTAAFSDVATNEAFCLRVAACCGLRAATVETLVVDGTNCLVAERFDRTLTGDGRVVRLHQEDFCQALGILPESKYEFEGGPSVAGIVGALRRISAVPATDVVAFARAVAFNFLVGNSDAHGKNFALLYDQTAGPRLAPLYDIVSTAVYDVTPRMAMSIGGEDDPDAVGEAAWLRLAADTGINGRLLLHEIRALAARVRECAAAIAATADEEAWHRPVIDQVCAVIERRAERIP